MTCAFELAVSEAEEAVSAYDLRTARGRYERAWLLCEDNATLRGAQIRKWQATVAAWQGRVGDARNLYSDALKRLSSVRPGNTDVLLERARCLAGRAQLEQQCGRFTLATRLLREAMEAAPADSDDANQIRLLTVGLEVLRPSGLEAATDLLDIVASAWGSSAPSGAGAARVLESRGLIAVAMGRNGKALKFLRDADALLEHGDQRVAAQVAHNLASVELAQGNPSGAAELLDRVVAFYGDQFPLLRLAAQVDRGMVHLALGATDDAIEMFASVDAELRMHSDAVRLRARALDGWGSALQARGELAAAAERHAEAIRAIKTADARERKDGCAGPPWAALEHASAVINLATDHLLTRRHRYSVRAMELFDLAGQLLDYGPETHPERARCTANLGVAYAYNGDLKAAERCFKKASSHYHAMHRVLDQVAVDHNRGCLLIERARGGSASLRPAALDLLIPAALIRDAVRFSLPKADQRRRWWEDQASASLGKALEVASDMNDARLVADLIACFRLPGPLGLERPGRDSSWSLATALDIIVSPVKPATDDSLLRLRRGPRIRLARGRIALLKYLRLADKRYRSQVRTGFVVDLR